MVHLCTREPRCLRRGTKGEISARGGPWPGSCKTCRPLHLFSPLSFDGEMQPALPTEAENLVQGKSNTIFLNRFHLILSSFHLFGRETTRPGQMFRKLTSYANKQTTRLFFRHHDTLRHITYDTPLEITIAIDNLTLVSLTTTLPPRSHSRHTGQGIKTV